MNGSTTLKKHRVLAAVAPLVATVPSLGDTHLIGVLEYVRQLLERSHPRLRGALF